VSAGSTIFSSVTRIARDVAAPVTIEALPRRSWATGDYVAASVESSAGTGAQIECTTGRMVDVLTNDLVVGALGERYSTLESVGSWRDVLDDLRLETLTRAGVLGRTTSAAALSRSALVPLAYKGHVLCGDEKVTMRQFVESPPQRGLDAPVCLMIGTSMSAGKTTAAKAVIRALKRRGVRVAGAKVTGVARYREILAMQDAGADCVVDFVDVGLPSTYCSQEIYLPRLRGLLSRLATAEPDVAVVEVGSSPLEPYNVDRAVEELGDQVVMTILSASDPFAVVGVSTAYGLKPDLITGRATTTIAGIELAERLSGVTALNLLDPGALPRLDVLLDETLGHALRG
jgi:hypothetical protein